MTIELVSAGPSILGIPWVLKFLWVPFLEMFREKTVFVVFTQIFGGICISLLALVLPMDADLKYSFIILGVIAFNFAVHDTVADGIFINALNYTKQAQYIGWIGPFTTFGKMLSQAIFGIALIYFGESLEITEACMIVMLSYGVILVLFGLYHLRNLPQGGDVILITSAGNLCLAVKNIIVSFFQKNNVIWFFAFLFFCRFAEGQAIKIVPLFMLADISDGGLNLSVMEVGVIYGVFPIVAFMIGSILGGYFIARIGLKKALFPLCISYNFPLCVFLILSILQPESVALITTLLAIEYFTYGFGFVGITLFIMQQIASGTYKMAHYVFATSLMSAGMFIPSSISGMISDAVGYTNFFVWVILATLPILLISWFMPFEGEPND